MHFQRLKAKASCLWGVHMQLRGLNKSAKHTLEDWRLRLRAFKVWQWWQVTLGWHMEHHGRLKGWALCLQYAPMHLRRDKFFESKECTQGILSYSVRAKFGKGKGIHYFGVFKAMWNGIGYTYEQRRVTHQSFRVRSCALGLNQTVLQQKFV